MPTVTARLKPAGTRRSRTLRRNRTGSIHNPLRPVSPSPKRPGAKTPHNPSHDPNKIHARKQLPGARPRRKLPQRRQWKSAKILRLPKPLKNPCPNAAVISKTTGNKIIFRIPRPCATNRSGKFSLNASPKIRAKTANSRSRQNNKEEQAVRHSGFLLPR
jgi:hypothetical protein